MIVPASPAAMTALNTLWPIQGSLAMMPFDHVHVIVGALSIGALREACAAGIDS